MVTQICNAIFDVIYVNHARAVGKTIVPRVPEDYVEEIGAMKPKPDLETEYRRSIRHTIRDESVLIIHSEETQPNRENNPTGEWMDYRTHHT